MFLQHVSHCKNHRTDVFANQQFLDFHHQIPLFSLQGLSQDHNENTLTIIIIHYYIYMASNDSWEPHQVFHDISKQHGIFMKGLTDVSPPELRQFRLADLHQMLDVFVDEEFEDIIHHSLKPKRNTWIDITELCGLKGCADEALGSSQWLPCVSPHTAKSWGKSSVFCPSKWGFSWCPRWSNSACGSVGQNWSELLNDWLQLTWVNWAWVIWVLPTSANLATHSCRHFIVEASMFCSVAKISSTRDLVTLLALVFTYCLRGICTSVSGLPFNEVIFVVLLQDKRIS